MNIPLPKQIPDGARGNFNQSSPPPSLSSPLALKKQLAASVQPCEGLGAVGAGGGSRSPERGGGGGGGDRGGGGGYSSEGDSDEE